MEEDLKKAIEVLRNGGIILYPTDTIWGIGCDATNADAVKRIYELKRRADNKSMLVIVGNVAMAERYVEAIPDVAYDLMDVAVSPLTIIYDNSVGLAPNLLGENNSIGIRVTHERFSAELCKRFRKPIVSTSANISGEKSAASFSEPPVISICTFFRQTPRERTSTTVPLLRHSVVLLPTMVQGLETTKGPSNSPAGSFTVPILSGESMSRCKFTFSIIITPLK